MRIACCLMVKNEEAVIGEWIAYHHLLGFDAFIIVDHMSTDNTKLAAAKMQDITTVHVLDEQGQPPELQKRVYMDVIAAFQDQYDWIAFIDSDEFIASSVSLEIRSLLENTSASGIAIPWLIFGSNGLKERGSGLLIEEFDRRSLPSFQPNLHVKSIVRPKAVVSCINAHCFKLDGDYVRPDGTRLTWGRGPGLLETFPEDTAWQVNHYYTRSRGDWARRMNRGQLGQFVRTWAEFDAYDKNDLLDLTAKRRSDEVRTLLERVDTSSKSGDVVA